MVEPISRRTMIAASATAAATVAIRPTFVLAETSSTTNMETAPSVANAAYYHFGIGDIEATIVSDGQIAFPAHPTYAPDTSEDDVHASMRAYGLIPPEYVLDANGLVLRRGDRTILIDTGWGAFAPGVGRMAETLRAAGIEPSDIDTVVLSHIHPDHVGGLRDAAGELAYPNAQVVLPEADLEQWQEDPDFGAMAVDEGFQAVFIGAAQSVLGLGERLEPVRDGHEVASGIALVAAAGHTKGHSVVRISSGDETFLYAADTFHDPAFDMANPAWRTAFDYDPAAAEVVRRRILDEAASESTTIMGYHMPFPGFGQVNRVGDGYVWRPSRWDVRRMG